MSMRGWIDAHCHLSDPRIFSQVDHIVRECDEAGISTFALGGIDPSEWDRQEQLAERYPGRIVKVFGLHPWWVDQATPETLEAALSELRARVGSALAIGETGLDGARDRMKRSRALQEQAFRAQLDLARQVGKPLVLHVVRAHGRALEILSEGGGGYAGIVHSYSGSEAEAAQYLSRGWVLSISARLTHPEALELQRVVAKCPAYQLVFETDSPDQPPVGHSERHHSPVSLFKVVQRAAEIRNEDPQTLLQRSRDNLIRVFRLTE